MVVCASIFLSEWAAASITMKKAGFAALPEGKIELRFDFSAPPPQPQTYMMTQPDRLVIDIKGASNAQGDKGLDVKKGLVKAVSYAQTEKRLRIVADLNEASAYKTFVDGNSLFVVVRKKTAADQQPAPQQSQAVPEQTQLRGIDFKRAEGGVGRVMIALSDDKAEVDISEEGNNVLVTVSDAKLARELEQRIDVQDFVTPVMFIDSMMNNGDTNILIKPSAEPYEYLAYQTDNKLVLDFKPVKKAKKADTEEKVFPYHGEPIDLNFQNVELRSVLQIIAEVAELNLVVSDTVGGNITLRLKNVPWDQALDIILKTKGLDQRTVGNVLLVAPAEEISERERVELESAKKMEELAPLRTEYIQVNYRKASDMKQRVEAASLISERGFIMADDQTNVLMVRETDEGIKGVRDTLQRFDVEVKQILVEARLVNARATVEKDLGIRWGLGYNDVDGADQHGWIVGSRTGNIDFANRGVATTLGGLQVDLGADVAAAGSQLAIGFKTGRSSLLAMELSALEKDGQVEIVSQPKVMTTNGKKAIIKSGAEIPYQTVEDSSVEIKFKDVVLSLEVTPRVSPGDRVALELVIKQDSLGKILPNGEISINKNELRTTVVVPDGQTIVLGGVFKNETNETINKVPLLGDAPVIGSLFRQRINKDEKAELLIFITPKMIHQALRSQ